MGRGLSNHPWATGVIASVALFISAPSRAHTVEAPRALAQPEARWPGGETPSHDVVVPLLLLIDREGRVAEVTVEVSLGPELDREATRVARAWRFIPARSAAGPVAAKIRAAVRFVGASPPPADAARGDAAPPQTQAPHQPPPTARPAPPAPAEEASVLVLGRRPPRAASQLTLDQRVFSAAPQGSGGELLRTVPGVYLSQHGGGGKARRIFFRGFDAVHGQDLELTVAGAPVNEVSNVHGQGYADLHFVIPEVVDRIEVLPGNYDPSQGDFAVAGSMRYHLGVSTPGLRASASAGSFNQRRLLLTYRPNDAGKDTFGAAEVARSDGFGVGRSSRRASALAQLSHPLSEHLALRVMGSVYAGDFGSAGVIRVDDVAAGAIDPLGSYDARQGGSSARAQFVTELTHLDADSELTFAPYVVARSLRLRFNYTGYLVHPQGDSTEQANDAVTAGLRASLRRRVALFRADDAVEVGLSARNDWTEQSQRSVATADGSLLAQSVDAGLRTTSVGAWLDSELHVLPRVVLRGGARVEGVQFVTTNRLREGAAASSQGHTLGERASLDVALLSGLHGVASWGRGFRTPSARAVADGVPLRLTGVRSGEVGLRLERPAGRALVSASAAGYWTALSDDVVFLETVGRNEPVPATRRVGAVAHLAVQLSDTFTSSLGGTWTRATFTEGDERHAAGDAVPFVPVLVTRADVAWRPRLRAPHSWGPLRAHLGAGLQGLLGRPLPYAERGDDVLLVDARLGLSTPRVGLHLDVRNALDRRWRDGEFVYASQFHPGTPTSSLPVRHFTAGEPRSLLVTAELRLP